MMLDELVCRRLRLGLSQERFADAIQVARLTVSKWETGKKPIPPGIDEDLGYLEAALDALIVEYSIAGRDGHPLAVHEDDEQFWKAKPQHREIPVEVEMVAAAEAKARLARESVKAEILDAALVRFLS